MASSYVTVRRLVGLNPVPATGVPFDDEGWALFSSAAGNAGHYPMHETPVALAASIEAFLESG